VDFRARGAMAGEHQTQVRVGRARELFGAGFHASVPSCRGGLQRRLRHFLLRRLPRRIRPSPVSVRTDEGTCKEVKKKWQFDYHSVNFFLFLLFPYS